MGAIRLRLCKTWHLPGNPTFSSLKSNPTCSARIRRRPSIGPIPNSVRAELYKMLAEARAAERLAWEPRKVLLYRTIFPQMTNWLPDEEGAQLRFEFEAEIKRLEAA